MEKQKQAELLAEKLEKMGWTFYFHHSTKIFFIPVPMHRKAEGKT